MVYAKRVRQPDLMGLNNEPLACVLALHLLETGRLLRGGWDNEKPGGNPPCKLEKLLCPF